MKNVYIFTRFMISLIIMLLSGMVMLTNAQTVMPLPPHGSSYSGQSRGFWFTAPIGFVITGVRAPTDINTNAQSIHLVRLTAPPPAYSGVTTSFTTLYYGSNIAGTTFVTMNIQVDSGDVIGVMAVRNNGSGTCLTSYATPVGPYTSYIGLLPVTITRMGWQGNIINSAAVDLWQEVAGAIGRAEIQYVLSQPTDAGLESFVNMPDSVCSGSQPVTVSLKNYGPNPLSAAKINWSVNNVVQPVYNWSGNLTVNSSANVTIGSYTFQTGVTYNITAFVSDANNDIDSVPGNDTITKTGIIVKPTPGLTLLANSINICGGDTAIISGTFTGTPPWAITIHDGAMGMVIGNIMNPAFAVPVTPASSKTYHLLSLTDGTGCTNLDTATVSVNVSPQPPSVITPMGSTACCMGDSVMLMGSIGLNFVYQWFKDGVSIPGATSYVLGAKESGNYTCLITSSIGCTNLSAPVAVTVHPLPTVFIGNDTAVYPGISFTLNAGAGFTSYLWSTGATSQTIQVDSNGTGIGVKTVWVKVTDNYGCVGTDTIRINFTPGPGIAESIDNAGIHIFPNPSKGKFEVQLTGLPMGEMYLELMGYEGKLLYSKRIIVSKTFETIQVDPGQIPDGIYLLRITGDFGSTMRKLVIRN